MRTAIRPRAQSRQLTTFVVIALIVGTAVIPSRTARAQTDTNLPTATTSTTLPLSDPSPSSTTEPDQINPTPSPLPAPTTPAPTSSTTTISDTDPSQRVPNTITPSPTTSSTTLNTAEQNSPSTSTTSTSTTIRSTTTSTSTTTIPWTTITHELGDYPSIKNIQLQVNKPANELIDGTSQGGIWLLQEGMSPPQDSASSNPSHTIVPDLPPGLDISASGKLFGTPTVTSPYTEYTISCNPRCPNAGFGLEVVTTKTPVIGFPESEATDDPYTLSWSIRDSIHHRFWHVRGGSEPYRYSISPRLPNWITLDALTGVIRGRAQRTQPRSLYTLTITDNSGVTASDQFGLIILGDQQPDFTEEVTRVTLSDFEYDTLPLANGGDGSIRYSIAPYRDNILIQRYQIEVYNSNRIEEYNRNGKKLVRSTTVPLLSARISGGSRELGRIVLVAEDGDGDLARIDLRLRWEADSQPYIWTGIGNIHLIEVRSEFRPFPEMRYGNSPFRLEILNSANLPNGMIIRGLKGPGQTYSRVELADMGLFWPGQDESLSDYPRQKFTIIITDRNGDEARDMFEILVRNRKPKITSETDPRNIKYTWVVGRRVDPIVLELEDRVGTPCVNSHTFDLPPGIYVHWTFDRKILIRGTPRQSMDRKPYEFYLVFTCPEWVFGLGPRGRSYVAYYSLDIEIELDFELQSSPPSTLRSAWQSGFDIDKIRFQIKNGNLPFRVDVTPELPIGINRSIETGEDCNESTDSQNNNNSSNSQADNSTTTIAQTTNSGASSSSSLNSSVTEVGYCVIISGMPDTDSAVGETEYTVTITDNGNESQSYLYTGRIMGELLPEYDAGFNWIKDVFSLHPILEDDDVRLSNPITYSVLDKDLSEFSSDWLSLHRPFPNLLNSQYIHDVFLRGTPTETGSGYIVISAHRSNCAQMTSCDSAYFDDHDQRTYEFSVLPGSDLKFPGTTGSNINSCSNGTVVETIPFTPGVRTRLPTVVNADGTVEYKDITPNLPAGIYKQPVRIPDGSGGSTFEHYLVGTPSDPVSSETIYTLTAVDNNNPARLTEGERVNSFLRDSTEEACYKFRILLNSSET